MGQGPIGRRGPARNPTDRRGLGGLAGADLVRRLPHARIAGEEFPGKAGLADADAEGIIQVLAAQGLDAH